MDLQLVNELRSVRPRWKALLALAQSNLRALAEVGDARALFFLQVSHLPFASRVPGGPMFVKVITTPSIRLSLVR